MWACRLHYPDWIVFLWRDSEIKLLQALTYCLGIDNSLLSLSLRLLAFITPQECRCWSGTESLWRERLMKKCSASWSSHVQRRSSVWDCELHLSSFTPLSHWNSDMFSCNMVTLHPCTPSLLPPFPSLNFTPLQMTNENHSLTDYC